MVNLRDSRRNQHEQTFENEQQTEYPGYDPEVDHKWSGKVFRNFIVGRW